MKRFLFLITFFVFSYYNSQCTSFSGCNPNTGLYSDNDPNKIEYDNIITVFHTSVIKDAFNNYKIWGNSASSDGIGHVLSPQFINSTNYPKLTGSILKVALGSYSSYTQLFVLTGDGLFVSGTPGTVIPTAVKTTSVFERLTVDGKIDGLPTGVNPEDVKMMFATTKALTITTCTGEVYVLSESPIARGNGSTGSDTEWSQVMENATTPLSDVIVTRGQQDMGFALKKDGTLWTWGSYVYSGRSTDQRDQDYQFATQMVLPVGIAGIKMIQGTRDDGNFRHGYFLLDTSNTLYCLGFNSSGVFGFKTIPNVFVKTWVKSQYPDGRTTNDISWISSNEHDATASNFAMINKNGTVYTAGDNYGYCIGHDPNPNFYEPNYFKIPNGISATDVITTFEVGGHCSAAVKKGTAHYGYVGHRINGSMGDGVPDSIPIGIYEDTFDFVTTPKIDICGVSCTQPVIENNALECLDSDVIFTIKSTPGDTVTYSLNGGTEQTITVDSTGKYEVKILKITGRQSLKITKFSNAICNETTAITSEIKVIDNSNIQIEEIGNNAVNAMIIGGIPKYEYQLLDENGNIVFPWQSSSIFTNLVTNYYQLQVRTKDTSCTFDHYFIYLNLPNVLTPNGDGKNDNLNLSFLQKTNNASIEIFDRFGKKMLTLNNKTPFQDYKNFSTGTYWYIFTSENGTTKTGWILIKNR